MDKRTVHRPTRYESPTFIVRKDATEGRLLCARRSLASDNRPFLDVEEKNGAKTWKAELEMRHSLNPNISGTVLFVGRT